MGMVFAKYSAIQVDKAWSVLERTLHHNYSKSDEITALSMDIQADKM